MPYRLAIALSLVLCDFVSLSHSAYLIYNTFTENASLFLIFFIFYFSQIHLSLRQRIHEDFLRRIR